MTAQQFLPTLGPARSLGRTVAAAAASLGAAVMLTACGGGTSHAASSRSQANRDSSRSCAGLSGFHHARVVVEVSPSSVLQRCVGFTSSTIPAEALLSDAGVTLGTQRYSFGLAVCQVDDVPAHYSQCLPLGKPYWALFVSHAGTAWTSQSTGISDITLGPGDSLGLRYDSPAGNPAPPPAPTSA